MVDDLYINTCLTAYLSRDERATFEKWANTHIDSEFTLHLEKLSANRKRYLKSETNAAWAAWHGAKAEHRAIILKLLEMFGKTKE